MDQIARGLEKQYPDTNTQRACAWSGSTTASPTRPSVRLMMLSGAVGLLFLIVCANIANLQLGLATARVRELAIRSALGAGRRRLVRQLLTESLIVSAIGGVLGFGIAVLARAAVQQFAASVVPLFAEIRLDLSVALFCAGLALLAPIIFGVLPALMSSKSGRLAERGEVRRATRGSSAAR